MQMLNLPYSMIEQSKTQDSSIIVFITPAYLSNIEQDFC
jgi:hypothetical protein